MGLGFSTVGAALCHCKSNMETKGKRITKATPIPRPSAGIIPEERLHKSPKLKHCLELPDSWYATDEELIFPIILLVTILNRQTFKVECAI